MAINQQDNSMFAPPTQEELQKVPSVPTVGKGAEDTGGMFAPPRKHELSPGPSTPTVQTASQADVPKQDALFAPPTKAELSPVESDMFAPPTKSEYQSLKGEIDQGLVQNLRTSPLVGSTPISDSEIDTIAKQHGVDSAKLRSVAPFLGAEKNWEDLTASDVPKAVAGQLGLVGFGVPQKLYKMTQDNNTEAAMDDLQELARARSSTLSGLGRAVALPGGALGKEASLAARAAEGAGIGAAGGFGASTQGHELSSTLLGGVGGAAAGALVGKIQQKLAARGAHQEAEALARQASEMDLTPVEREIIPAAKEADDALVHGLSRELTPEEVQAVTERYITHDSINNLLDSKTTSGQAFRESLHRDFPERVMNEGMDRVAADEAPKQLVSQLQDTLKKKFADSLSGKVSNGDDAISVVDNYLNGSQGKEFGLDRFRSMLEENHVKEFIRSNAIRTSRQANLLEKAVNAISDAQYVFRHMDEKLGNLGAENAQKDIVANWNRMSVPQGEAVKDLQGIFRNLRKAGVDEEAQNAGQLIEKLEAPNFRQDSLSPSEQKIYQEFAPFFEKQRDFVNTRQGDIAPLNIPMRENYIPSQLMDGGQLERVLKRRMEQAMSLASVEAGRPISDLSQLSSQQLMAIETHSPEIKSTFQFIRSLGNTETTDAAELSRVFKETFLTRSGRNKLESVARASLERDGKIPMWARETNLYKLADKYVNDTLKNMYLRQPLEEMRHVSGRLRSTGMDAESDYVDRFLGDMHGARKGTMAEFVNNAKRGVVDKLDEMAEKATSPAARATLKTLRGMPMLMDVAARNVYPNYLGLNARGLIQNATQTFTKTIPEFGNAYGSLLALRGGLMMKGSGGIQNVERRLLELGLAPGDFVKGGREYLSEGLMRSRGYRAVSGTHEGIVRGMMYAYQKMETVNRGISLTMSEMMADDLVRGSKQAMQSLSRMPNSVQALARDALQSGNHNELVKGLATHIINSTQYQYNRPSMSEFGRTMGPLFSAFSKWPAATIGDIAERFRSKGITEGTRNVMAKYIAPLLLLEGVDRLMGEGSPQGLSDRKKKLLGASGLSTVAPIGNLSAIAKGDFFTPPAVDMFLKSVALPIMKGDAATLPGTLANAAYSFAPFGLGGVTRFLTDDLVTMAKGYRPDGKNIIERTKEGARELGIK